jgi:predicted HAD superfamily Cof-like phosphohydrolase
MTKSKFHSAHEKDYLDKVSEFHDAFGHPVLVKPEIPDQKRCELRISLLTEELKELQEAIDKKDIVAAADAFCDLQYVLSGAILEFGLWEKFNALFAEVHRSNMSKACNTAEEALQTREHYLKEDKTESYFEQKDDLFFVYRKSDNKTLKSINYSKADLKSIIENV